MTDNDLTFRDKTFKIVKDESMPWRYRLSDGKKTLPYFVSDIEEKMEMRRVRGEFLKILQRHWNNLNL